MLFLNRRGNFSPTKTVTVLSLLVPYIAYSSLSATTAQTIQGYAPKLNLALETEIATQNFSLLGLELSGTSYYSGTAITINTPALKKLSDFSPIVGALVAGQALDSDGDANFNLSALSATSLSIQVKDKNNTIVPSTAFNDTLCELSALGYEVPYTLTVMGDLKLTTQYGDPAEQQYTVTKGVNVQPQSPNFPLSVSGICYAKPNLNYDFLGATNDVWDPTKGFKPQSTPSKNFPTTGFNNAFFELKTIGIDAQTLGFSAITQGNVTATMSATATDTIKVTLSGPSYSTPAAFIAPGVIAIKDNANTISYSFNINQWVIANPNVMADFNTAKTYCDTLAGGTYQLPTNAQYTNSNVVIGGSSPSNHYDRRIGEGFLPEWGALYHNGGQYPNTDWNTMPPLAQYHSYWSKDPHSAGRQYDVGVSGGNIGDNDITTNVFYAACISQ